ncbi:MAG: glycosyltransferase family 2 protein, partial [Chloroflexaceae bacterium]|nr:glycosyltransferase family 2 protein [Chloroflexaceae bacterium]
MTTTAPNLAIIIVSWNVRDLLRRCLQATAASLAGSGIGYEIIVVDNGSSDATPAMLRAEFPHVTLLEAGANLGFAGGNNLALRRVLRRGEQENRRTGEQENRRTGETVPLPISPSPHLPISPSPHPLVPSSPDYVLLLNPDTEPVGDAIPRLVRHMAANPQLIAVGPQLRYADSSVQSSRRRFPTRLTFFWESTPLERLWPQNPWARRYHYADQPDTRTHAVDWLVGAALLVRSAAITRAGPLDEGFFMYSEELEWQWRLQEPFAVSSLQLAVSATTSRAKCELQTANFGLRSPVSGLRSIMYLPESVIIHHEGKSSEQAITARHLNFQQSKLRLARMWYGPWFALLLRLFLLGCYSLELAVETVKFALGHR